MISEPTSFAFQLDEIVALEGEPDQRVRTLLWLTRMFYGQDELDSYAGYLPSRSNLTSPSRFISMVWSTT